MKQFHVYDNIGHYLGIWSINEIDLDQDITMVECVAPRMEVKK